MSFDWYRLAHTHIAQGYLTNSKRVESFIKGITPTHAKSEGSSGAFFDAVDGKRYLDFTGALGTCLFGYNHPLIKRARDSAPCGPLPLGTDIGVNSAKLVKERVPFVKKVRFFKTGTEACMAAVRVARAHTGRDKVLSSDYHGWADDFISLTPPGLGVPKRSFIEPLTSFDQLRTDIAAVIVEPIVTEYSERRKEWLTELVRRCRVNGILVIFDEVITGFRWPGLTFSKDSGIYPDIICLGKAMGGGQPLSCVGMAEHIGDNVEWFASSTFADDPQAFVVFKQVCTMLHNQFKIEDLWKDGGYFIEEFNAIWPDKLKLEGYPTRAVFKGDHLVKALFFQESHKAQILFGSSWFYGFQHLGMREAVIGTCKDILQRIKNNQVKLEGEPPASPFAEKVRAA